MEPVSAFVVFVIVWWLVLFCILPIGMNTKHEIQEGEKQGIRAPGAPESFNLKKVLYITSAVTFVLWLLIIGLIEMELFSFRDYVLQD